MPEPSSGNTLGNASLALGIASVALVFGIGLCAMTGFNQGWIRLAGTPLYVCGASSAFVGLVGAALGLGGLFGSGRSRATAIAGLILGAAGACLFLLFLAAIRNGAVG
jgi:hypothetical protein